MNGRTLEQIINAARQAANAGRWPEAEKLWEDVRQRDPGNKHALFSLAVHATQRGDLTAARSLAEAACKAAPGDPNPPMMLARIERDGGNAPGELEAIERALTIDPYFIPGVLAKAAWMERHGPAGAANMYYRAALKIAPPEAQWPPALRASLDDARRRTESYGQALEAHLSSLLGEGISGLPAAQAERWREAISIRAGRTEPYLSQSNQFTVPRLPAIPFFERDMFPWAAAIEAKTDVITKELTTLLEEGADGFTPYVSYKPGEPMNQFASLNNSSQWSAFQLYRHGVRVEENCERCPETLRALAAVELAEFPSCPNVMFSALAPGARIPPHQGESNIRVVTHLPLIVPKGCSYRVGFEWRTWRVGEILVFDDTIEHEAHNDSEELRVVLIFDTWNPLLSRAERDIAASMAVAAQAFAPPRGG